MVEQNLALELWGTSIICLANNTFLLKKLNSRLKRNDFMPFGPIIISYLADKCLKILRKIFLTAI